MKHIGVFISSRSNGRYFSFIAEQTSPGFLSLAVYATNIYGVTWLLKPKGVVNTGEVNCGRRLWKEPTHSVSHEFRPAQDIYDLVLRFEQPVVSFEDMVDELETPFTRLFGST